MCELLGISFNNPVRPTFSFHALLEGSWHNRDGWGLGYYPEDGKTAQIFKESYCGSISELAKFLAQHQGLYANLFIAHIRKASRGENIHENTHPFNRYYKKREWLFAHNGTLPDLKRIPRQNYLPIGNTDSEQAFCQLLSSMRKAKVSPFTKGKYHGYTKNDYDFIYEELQYINDCSNGFFNCIFSDGEHLFCYRDRYGARDLSYLHREYPFHSTMLRDSDIEIDLRPVKEKDDKGYIIATKPLSSEDWIPFKNGEMIVFRRGNIVTSRCQ